jgi:hypothetical protein
MTRPTFKPRTERIAAAIYYHAKPLGWDCTSAYLAEATGEHQQTIVNVLRWKGWMHRIRSTSTDGSAFDPGSFRSSHAVRGMYLAEAVAAGKVSVE